MERKKMDDMVAQIIREGVGAGVFSVEDARTTARALLGMISFTYTWWRSGRRLSRDEAAEEYARLALRLVGSS
jgi:hypothetical protein